jgi:hypothetical protein
VSLPLGGFIPLVVSFFPLFVFLPPVYFFLCLGGLVVAIIFEGFYGVLFFAE